MKYYNAFRKGLGKEGDEASTTDSHAGTEPSGEGGATVPAPSLPRPPHGDARGEPRKPRKPDSIRAPEGSLGFLGPGTDVASRPGAEPDPGLPSDSLRHFVPPSGSDPLDALWQAELENWPDDLKEAWDERAALMEYEGGHDRETAERMAFEEIEGREARDSGTHVDSPDPWERILAYLRWSGFTEVDPAELDDYKLVPLPQDDSDQSWKCRNPYCRHKGGWWMSAHGVVNCMNCRPPAFPELVVAEGDVEDAPVVEPDRSNQAAVPPATSDPS